MKRLIAASAGATLAMCLSVLPALAYHNLSHAVLRLNEVPSVFSSTATHVYTAYSDILHVKSQNGPSKVDLTCQSPTKADAGGFSQAMIQAFGHTGAVSGLDLRVCSYLYGSAAAAHRAYGSLVAQAAGNAKILSAKKVSVHIGNESSAWQGKILYQAVFRSGNYVAYYYHGDFAGPKMSPAAFFGLSGKLLSRLQ